MEPLQPHGGKGQTHCHPMVAGDGPTITPWTQRWTHVTLWIRDGHTITPWTQGRTHVTCPRALHLPSTAGFAPKGHRWLPCPVPAGLTPPAAAPSAGDGPHAGLARCAEPERGDTAGKMGRRGVWGETSGETGKKRAKKSSNPLFIHVRGGLNTRGGGCHTLVTPLGAVP